MRANYPQYRLKNAEKLRNFLSFTIYVDYTDYRVYADYVGKFEDFLHRPPAYAVKHR